MCNIVYKSGNVLDHIGNDVIIPHVCNDIGKWGAGFTASLDGKYPEVGKEYKRWFYSKEFADSDNLSRFGDYSFNIGNIQVIRVNYNTEIVNMIAQCGVGKRVTPCADINNTKLGGLSRILEHIREPKNYRYSPISYEGVYIALKKVGEYARKYELEVAMPMIGAGLAKGDWDFIEEIIKNTLNELDVTVYMYGKDLDWIK